MASLYITLVVVLVVACGPYACDAVIPNCPGNGDVCLDCLTRGDCTGVAKDGPAVSQSSCAPQMACKVVSGVATCMPLADVPQCNCNGGNAGCDAYNTDKQIFCVPPGAGRSVYLGANCANTAQTCSEGQCVAPADVLCTNNGVLTGFIVETPTCASGVFCAAGAFVYRETCAAGQYFNKAISTCEAYPPNPCTGCTKTKCPLISDCSKYAVCISGQVVDADESCEVNVFFNAATGECDNTLTAPNGICADYVDCVFESTTSTVPSTPSSSNPGSGGSTPVPGSVTPSVTRPPCTSANVNTRYPHENCKMYYTCRLVTRTSYKYVEVVCSSTYVFNPTILKCDLPGNVVPPCVVPN